MKFFVPFIEDQPAAERMYAAVKEFASKETGWMLAPGRVFALRYRMNDREFLAQVGIPHPPGPEAEVVVCIFRSAGFYLICTQNRGVMRNLPLVIPRGRVSDVEFFNNVRDEIV
jgi:hypothetical protein